jgi:hypothetical protein
MVSFTALFDVESVPKRPRNGTDSQRTRPEFDDPFSDSDDDIATPPQRNPASLPCSVPASLPCSVPASLPCSVPANLPCTDPASLPYNESTVIPSTKGPTVLEKQHMDILNPIITNPSVQTLLSFSKIHVPEKPLHGRQITLFQDATKRVAEAFLARPSENNLLNFLILPRVLGWGISQGTVTTTLKSFPSIVPNITEPVRTDQSKITPDPVSQARRLLEKGYIGKAAKSLYDNAPISTLSPETMESLRKKHPIG